MSQRRLSSSPPVGRQVPGDLQAGIGRPLRTTSEDLRGKPIVHARLSRVSFGMRFSWLCAGVTALAGCAPARQTLVKAELATPPAATRARPGPAPAAPSTPPQAATPGPRSCGALGCRVFDTPEQAFASVLERNPRVLAVGEAHAPRGSEGIDSAVRRFTRTLLPVVAHRAQALVVELPVSDGRCGQSERKLDQVREEVSRQQSDENPNEYLDLAKVARSLGVIPYPLRLTCDQFAQIAGAGQNDIDRVLSTIAETMGHQVQEHLQRPTTRLVLTYGGALHNDVAPRPERTAWSFGPRLRQATGGAYVELDLIVPEYIQDTSAWRALEWTQHFDPDAHPDATTLYELSPGSFVMIFPRSRAVPEPGP